MLAHSASSVDRHDLPARAMAALRDYRAIWRVTVRERENVVSPPFQLIAGTLVFVLLVVFAMNAPWYRSSFPVAIVRALIGVGTLWLAMTGILLFAPSSFVLNSNANARLVPRQRRRLVQMTAAFWLLTMIGSMAAYASWTVLLIAACWLPLGMAGKAGSRIAGNLCTVTIMLWGFVLPRMPAFDPSAHLPIVLAVFLLELLVAFWLLNWLYPAGGERHARSYARRVEHMRDLAQPWRRKPGGGRAGLKGIPQLYAWTLRRSCRRADPGALLVHACGPTVHWSTGGSSVAFVLGVAVVARFAMDWGTPYWRGLIATLAPASIYGFPIMVAFGTVAYGQVLARTRSEQALLRLSPLAGAADLLNRRLGARLLRIALLNWALTTGVLMLTTWLLLPESGVLLRQLAWCCLAGQVAMMGLLRDYARGDGWGLALGLAAGGVAATLAVVALCLGTVAGSTPWPWLIVLSIGAAAVRLHRDWQRMVAAPPAFPAGRLGSLEEVAS